MVPWTSGRSGPRTTFDSCWYRLGMSRAQPRAAWFATVTILAATVAAGCLPPPTASTSDSTSAQGSNERANATPQPSKTPKPQDLAIDAFVKQVATGKLTYRVSFDGEVRLSADVLPVSGAMDVAGKNFATSFTYNFEPEYPGLGKARVQVRGVGAKGWIKRGSAAWRPIKTYGVAQSYVPFKSVTADTDVRYLGPVEIGGKTFHKVVVQDAVLIHPNTIPYQITDEKVDESEVEFLIDAAGRPRSGTWILRGQARVGASGQLQRVVYELKLTFSDVGSKISIRQP